ncbi:MAG TPA: hypothetical protein VF234_06200 [Limnochordia bacterium]
MSHYTRSYAANHAILALRDDLLCHLRRLPLDFVEKNRIGNTM